MLENLKDLELGIKGASDKEEKDMFIDLLKDDIKEADGKVDAETQKFIDKLKEMYLGAEKKTTPKVEKKPTPKTTKKPRAKTTPEQKAKNREKVQNATGKTIEECKEILAKYEALRGKTTQKDKQRVDKLKDEDKIIDGTNVKTADAITETTAKQVPKKIKQEVDAIEKEAEKEAKEEVNSSKGNKLPYDEWFKFWGFSIDKKTYYYVASSKDGKVWASDEKKSEVVKMLKDFYSENIKEIHPYMFSSKGSNRSETKEGKKEVEKIKIEKIEEKVKDMTKDLADKSSELIKAMSKTISDLSPSKDEVRKFLLDIRGQVDVLLKAYKFGGAVQSYNVPWMGGQPMPSYAKGGKFDDGGWIKSLPKAMGYEVEDVFEPMAKSSKDKFEFRKKVREWDSDGVLKEGKSGDEWIDKQYQSYSKGGKFADGGKVLMEISTHKAVRNGDKIDIISKGIEIDDLKFNDEKLYSIPYENIDDLLPIFDGLEENNRINLSEYEYKKGGKLPRKKGLGWKRDRERISQEPHEQAYKSKRKGNYSSFEMGGEVKDEYKDFFKRYEENEDNNAHLDNAIMLVSEFGTADELERLMEIQQMHEKQGYLTVEQSREQYEIQKPYYRKMFAKGGDISNSQKEENVGQEIADFLYLKKKRPNSLHNFPHYETTEGTKTDIGLFNTMHRIIEDYSNDAENGGKYIAEVFQLKKKRPNSLSNFPHYETSYGTKTDTGLYHSLNRILEENSFKKGGRTTRAINQDRARLSKEKHEQAYLPKRKGNYSSFEMGGKTMIDEEFSNVPEELEEVFGMYNEDEETYSEMKRLKGIANQRGYDFDYGLDGEPTEFWEINKMAKGGKTWVQDAVDSPNFREGAFTRKAEARGMSTDAFMNQVLHSPNLYDERTRKQAQFMKNAFND